MDRFDFCADCRSRSTETNDMSYSCGCGKQGLCFNCGNVSKCSQCGNGCCKDCSFPLPCCGNVLCGSNDTDAETQSCFDKHFATNLSCGHHGCILSDDCRVCNGASDFVVNIPAAAVQLPPTATMSMKRSWNRLASAKPPITASTSINQVVPFNGVNSTALQPHKKSRVKRAARSLYQGPIMAKEAPPVASNNKKRKLSNMSFPQILWKMVTETAKTSPDIISWIENGEAFVVHEPSSRKLGSILQKYFQHGKYSSLQRQLNMYGFKKHTRGRYNGAFHQPFFHRDRPNDVGQILRRPPPSRSSESRQFKPKVASIARSSKRLAKLKSKAPPPSIETQVPPPRMEEARQVLSPNKRIVHKKRSILAKHLPPKKRRIFPQEVENTPIATPVNGMKETFKEVSDKRPKMMWSDTGKYK